MTATTALFRNELRLLYRTPSVSIWTVILPVLALVIMCAIPGARQPLAPFGNLSVVQAYQPTLIVFTITIMALQILPMTLGQYRESGFLRRLRTTPVHPRQLLTAVLGQVFVVVFAVSLFLTVFPLFFGIGDLSRLPLQVGILIVTALSVLGVGTMLAAIIPSSRVAGGVGSALAVVMWFAAGMWIPRASFPDWAATLAEWTPGGAAATLLQNAAYDGELGWQPFACLVVWGLGGFLIATRTFKWE